MTTGVAFRIKPGIQADITGLSSSQDLSVWSGLNGVSLVPGLYYLGLSFINKLSTTENFIADLKLTMPAGNTLWQLTQVVEPNEEVLIYKSATSLLPGEYTLECNLYEEVTMSKMDTKSVMFSVQAPVVNPAGLITGQNYQMPGSTTQLALDGAVFAAADIGKQITILVVWKNTLVSGSEKLNANTLITCKLPNASVITCPISNGIGVAVAAGNSGIVQTTLTIAQVGAYTLTTVLDGDVV